MGFFSWIVVGLIAGILAKWIMPGKENIGLIITIALGVIGGFVGGLVMSLIGKTPMDEFSLPAVLVATAGAVLVLFLYGKLKK